MSFGALLFHLAVWAGPVGILVGTKAAWRRSAYGLVPFGLLVQGFLLGAFSAVLHPALAPGWGKLLLVETLSVAIMWRALAWVYPRLRGLRHPVFSPKAILFCALGASLATADLVAIFSGQGFAFEKGRWFHSGETYFRAPMNNDITRHVVVTNSLLRRAESTPFLPHSRYSYQLFWHHLAALSVGPLASWWAPITNYPLVVGHVGAVAFLFFFMLLWALHARRPGLFETPLMAVAIGVLVFSHADIFHFLLSLLSKGVPGIEADWSVKSEPFRNFSVKLMGLTAPQHALFFFFFLGYLERGRWVSARWGRPAFALPCFVASPVLAGFIFPVWWAGEVARLYDRPALALRRIGDYIGTGFIGVLAYVLLLRANPVGPGFAARSQLDELLSRQSGSGSFVSVALAGDGGGSRAARFVCHHEKALGVALSRRNSRRSALF